MDLGIRGRVALVTGASSGIGKAVALALAEEGAKIAVAARRLELCEAVASEARTRGASDARAYELNLNDDASIGETIRRVKNELGAIDILVANSGGPKPGSYTQVVIEDWDVAYRSLLRCMVEMVSAVLPSMRNKKWGRIVALTSSSVKQPIPNLVLSNAFRTALVSALKTLSMEAGADGVTVNAIATGRILTDRLRELYPDEAEMQRSAESNVSLRRVATPEEFAPMVAFLCSEQARYVTGQTIAVDGGLIKSLF